MTVYGYIITLSETVGHGSPLWDEYYETEERKTLETRLFKDKETRDNECAKDKEKHRNEHHYTAKIEETLFESELE